MDELVARARSASARTPRARSTRSARRCMERLDARGHPRLAGRRPGRRARRVDVARAAARRAGARARARDRSRSCRRTRRSSPGTSPTRSPARATPPARRRTSTTTARELKRRDPGRLVALDIWGAHPPKFAGPDVRATSTRSAGRTTSAGTRQPYATPDAARRSSSARSSASCREVFPDKVIAVTEFGAEGSTRNPTDEPGGLRVPGRACCAPTSARTRSIPGVSRHARLEPARLRRRAVASAAARSPRSSPDISLVRGLNEKGLHRYDGAPEAAAARSCATSTRRLAGR